MPAVNSNEACVICGRHESVMHSHHTIPRSRGGEDSCQIILCSSCHNILHANANYIAAQVRNPNRKRAHKSFWKTEVERQRAEPWLQILVRALLTPNAEAAKETEHTITFKLKGEDFRLFKLLAAEFGSQEKAVEYCVKFVLDNKGYTREKAKPELWFLPVSKQ